MMVINFCNKVIEYSFYALFFLVPLVFWSGTSELFEFNKMWLMFGMTVIIAGAWFSKMIVTKQIYIRRTPLDIFILLFLSSQIISTLLSLDWHVSWWGYYTRWNGGLLSIISYIFLYYAFVSNLSVKHVLKTLSVSLASGLLVALWGTPSHFGYDPTCFVFRGELNTSCWTDAFKPTIRAFSTLGQPAWYAAYLAVLIPLAAVYGINQKYSHENTAQKKHKNSGIIKRLNWKMIIFFALTLLFYVNLIFANTRAAYIAIAVEMIIFWAYLFYSKIFARKNLIHGLTAFVTGVLLCSFLFGAPVDSLNKFTLPVLTKQASQETKPEPIAQQPAPAPADKGVTDSGKIRLIVWKGAIEAWRNNFIFGTGVETFAFAYYKYRPVEHNLTSEWDYLYNKAHNEYLNYLATTGIYGLGTYLSIIAAFLFLAIKHLITLHAASDEKSRKYLLLSAALVTGYLSILITNFLGFSVAIMNLYLFLIPAFVFILLDLPDPERALVFGPGINENGKELEIRPFQWTAVIVITIFSSYLLIGLFQYWYADMQYALGYNFDRADAYEQGYDSLVDAARIKPNEPVYKDELSVNLGTLATALYLQKDASNSAQLTQQAIELNNQVVESHPNNVVFWKDRVRLFYTAAQGDPQKQQEYLAEALKAIQKAHELAPTDAKISYNLGVLYGQNGDTENAIKTLKQTIELKPDYLEAYNALGLMYHETAVDKNNKVTNTDNLKKAIEAYEYALKNLSPDNEQIKKTLDIWKNER